MPAIALDIRANEGAQPQNVLFWDAVWNARLGQADWALAAPSETGNKGGLQAQRAIETAVILCLFTDRLCPPGHPLAGSIEAGDPRGWWGDGIDVRGDLGETPLGSLLWLLERSALTASSAQWAQSLALDALAPMIGQNSIVRAAAQAFVNPRANRLDLAIQLYARDGSKIFDRRFDDIWAQFSANGAS